MSKTYWVYILSNRSRTLYVGVTGNLLRRMWEHRTKQVPGFTSRYDVTRLVYFEQTENPISAIEREKQLKRWSRPKKIWLIERDNPEWRDLAAPWFEPDSSCGRTKAPPLPGRGSLHSRRRRGARSG